MRTFKTGIAVFVVILIFQLTDRGNPMIAALSAVFTLRQDFENTLSFGISRLIGNTLGGGAAILYFFIFDEFKGAEWVTLIVLPILLMLLISLNDGIQNNKGIVGSVAALLMIALLVPESQTMGYVIERVFDTFIGTGIAIILNIGVHPLTVEEEVKRIEDKMQK
jgi:uncharacterized membrane protein YgaE (UPF0421/DUF939 family)